MAVAQYSDSIQKIYIAYLGRPADPAGLDYWTAEADSRGGDLSGIFNSFSASQESQSLYGGMTVEQTIITIYHYLFNRVPDADGLAYWQGQISSGSLSSAAAAYAIFNGATGTDITSVSHKLSVANAFTDEIDTAAEKAGYGAADSFAYARSFLADVDANDSTLAAAQAALINAVAIATGTTGPVVVPDPQFFATVTGGVVTFSGPATGDITVSWSGAVGASTATFSRGGFHADSILFGGAGASSVDLAPTETLTGTADTLIGLDVIGAGSVTLVDTATHLDGKAFIAPAGLNDVLTVTDTPSVDTNLALLTGFEVINLAGTAGAASITIADGAGITVNNVGASDLKVTLGDGGQTFNGGSGNDDVTVGGDVASTVDLGTGNNALTLSGINIVGTYAAGVGTDSLTLLSATPDISAATITGFENLTLIDNATVTLATEQVSQFSGNIEADGTETFNLTNAGTFTALNHIEQYNLADGINDFTATDSSVSVFGGSGNDTFHFSADQIASYLTSLDGGAGNNTLYIDGTTTQTMDLSATVSNIGTVNVTGNTGNTGTATFTNMNGSGVVLNYTKASGDDDITLGSGGQTLNILGSSSSATLITGGAAVDQINLGSVGSGSETIIAFGPNMSNNTQTDTVSNFNATGNDYFQTGIQATALGSFVIGSASTATFLGTIAAGLSGFLSHTGQAFQISIIGGTAAGVYLFQNTGSNTSQFDSTDFFVKLTGDIGVYSELNLVA